MFTLFSSMCTYKPVEDVKATALQPVQVNIGVTNRGAPCMFPGDMDISCLQGLCVVRVFSVHLFVFVPASLSCGPKCFSCVGYRVLRPVCSIM
jgi:hypothetical protein